VISAIGLVDPVGKAAAQQAQASPALFTLFDTDSVEVRPDGGAQLADAIRKVQAPRECPLGRLTIFTPTGDELFQNALAQERQNKVLAFLNGQGIDVAGRLFVNSIVFGGGGPGNDSHFEAPPRDEQPPTLRTTSNPRKGSKVKPNQEIKVTMVARDDANEGQTGIKTIQLVANSENGRFIASENYAPCSNPLEKRVEATYTVPANPPPIVRLTALAEDHANHMDTDVGEFPTGDWYGTLQWSFEGSITPTQTSTGSKSKRVGRADFVLHQKRGGEVEGTLIGSQTSENWWGYAGNRQYCLWRTASPQVVRAKLDGMYEQTRGYPMFQASAVEAIVLEGLVDSRQCISPATRSDHSTEFTAMLPGLVHRLTRAGDTFTARQDISAGSVRGHYVLTLRRALD